MRLPGSSPLLGVGSSPRASPGLAASPNPFVGHTALTFQLARPGWVSVEVVEVSGRLVRRIAPRWFEPGPHAYEWDGRDDAGRTLPPGLYFARIRMPQEDRVTRVSRLR
jgi:hypothetical protein